MYQPAKRFVLFGDTVGIPQLLHHIPSEKIVGIVAASIRPQYHEELKTIAQNISVPLLIQPPKKNLPLYTNFISQFQSLNADCIFCNSYSMLIQPDTLDSVAGKAFNLHFSLLPKHRGPNPIQWALINGDQYYGATIHLMGHGFDNGEIVDQISVPICNEDTWISLFEKIVQPSEKLLQKTIPDILSGAWTSAPQNEQEAIINSRIPTDSFEINFNTMTNENIFNLIRAQIAPLKGPFITVNTNEIRFDKYLSLEEVDKLRKQYS